MISFHIYYYLFNWCWFSLAVFIRHQNKFTPFSFHVHSFAIAIPEYSNKQLNCENRICFLRNVIPFWGGLFDVSQEKKPFLPLIECIVTFKYQIFPKINVHSVFFSAFRFSQRKTRQTNSVICEICVKNMKRFFFICFSLSATKL